MSSGFPSAVVSFFSFLKPSHWKQWGSISNVYRNYFWLITITAVLHIFTGKSWLYTYSFPLLTIGMIYLKKRSISLNLIDIFWIIGFFWMVLTWTYNDYTAKPTLILRCFATQITFMLSYWIGRMDYTDNLRKIITNSYKPLAIVCIVGLWYFLKPPEWYLRDIENFLQSTYGDNISYESSLEFYRLKSIFPTTYTLTYFANIVLIYFWFKIFGKSYQNKTYYYLFTALLLTCSILAMMRGPIVCSFISLVIAIIYSSKYSYISNTFAKLSLASILIIVSALFILQNVDPMLLQFLSDKISSITSSDSNLIDSRINIMNLKYSSLGDGVGRHNVYVGSYPPNFSIPDGEYIKILVEQGYIGLIFFLIPFIIGILKSLRYFRYLYLELCLLIMVLICMIGADPISTYDKHPFIFWLTLGQVSAFKNIEIFRKQKK